MAPSTSCSTGEGAVRTVEKQTRVDRRVSAAFELIHAHLSNRISVAELARVVNMPRWRFCHVSNTELPFPVRRVIYVGRRSAARSV